MVKKSLIVMSVSSVCCLTVLSFAWQTHQQLSQAQATVQTLQEEKEALQQAQYERIAERIKQEHPKTVVGEVFKNGYLKKHGNHYHFVHGTPPADAIYETESKMAHIKDDYVFDVRDVVEENEVGYVVRHGDHFHFVFKGEEEQPVTEEEEEPFIFKRENIVSEDAEGYVVRHGDHTHYIPKKDLAEAPVVPDVMDARERKGCRLLRIPHGNHFHDVLDCGEGTALSSFADEEEASHVAPQPAETEESTTEVQ